MNAFQRLLSISVVKFACLAWLSWSERSIVSHVKYGVWQGHRVEYDDGDIAFEDLSYRTYRLPNLTGDKIFNPDADVESPMVVHNGPSPGQKSGDALPVTVKGAKLIGQRIEVWWAEDEQFYSGVIKSYKKVHKAFCIPVTHL